MDKVTDILVEYTDALLQGKPVSKDVEPELAAEFRPLWETVEFLHGVLRPAPVPAELAQRLENRLAAEWRERQEKPASIPQALRQALEQLISRALSDEGFRARLIEDPEQAARGLGLTLTPYELAALRTMDTNQLASLIQDLDERISKTSLGPTDLSGLLDLMER
ncbi:MAG: hypothetical protein FJZ89_02890 [Chloroflexi bacterium]|nr:hypothetical protein [Chloroflexota bacterium]